MPGISCCCSLPASACATCPNLHPELAETLDKIALLASQPLGWICPVCGCGLSPHIQQCSCQSTVTSSSYLS